MRNSLQGRRLVQKVNIQVKNTISQTLHMRSPLVLQVTPGKATRPNKVACFSLYGEDSLDLSPKPQIPAPLALKVEQEQQAVRLAWRKPSTHRDIRNHAVSGEVGRIFERIESRLRLSLYSMWSIAPSVSQATTILALIDYR